MTVLLLSATQVTEVVLVIVGVPVMLWVLLRLGLLAFVVMVFALILLRVLPVPSAADVWYGDSSWVAIGALAGLAVVAWSLVRRN